LTDCASSWSFFICQPLNQQQTTRCDKCDVGWAGVREIKKEKKEREMKKYFPAACCLSKGWPIVTCQVTN
jgi:hypothetical protein